MPQTTNYGFEFESPTTLPGVSITGGPSGANPILAEQVDTALDTVETSLDGRVTVNEGDIATIEGTLVDLEPVYARVELSGTQTLAGGAVTRIEANSVIYQSETMWDAGNFEFEIPAGRGGLYAITASVAYASVVGGRRSCDIESTYGRLSSDLNTVNDTGNVRVTTATQYVLSPGDLIWFTGFHSSGGNLDVEGSATQTTHLAICRIAPTA